MQITVNHEGGNLWVLRITGLLKKAELDAVQSSVWKQVSPGAKIRQLALLEDFQGWEKTEAWSDMSFMVEHGDDIERMAIVGDPKWRDEALLFVGAGIRRTAIQFFPSAQEAQARAWLAAD